MVLVRKLCKIWTFGDESSKPVFEQKPLFFRRFSWKTEPAQSVRDLTFGTEGCRFESYRVYLSFHRRSKNLAQRAPLHHEVITGTPLVPNPHTKGESKDDPPA